MILIILVGVAALLVAICAAFFSITGLGQLFSGASTYVMIMATSLEFAKLITATFLKIQWDKINKLLRFYLVLSVIVLMGITSAGIFGYLSNAFQKQNLKIEMITNQIKIEELKINSYESLLQGVDSQMTSLISSQNKVLNNSTNRNSLRFVTNRDEIINKLQSQKIQYQDSIQKYRLSINQIKTENIDVEREIGGFKYIAQIFNFELDVVVKFFIILIVFVFDPLAIVLVIAFNHLLMGVKKKDTPISSPESNVDKEQQHTTVFEDTPIDAPDSIFIDEMFEDEQTPNVIENTNKVPKTNGNFFSKIYKYGNK